MKISGFWTGEYTYSQLNDGPILFHVEIQQVATLVEGTTTEQNTFDELAGQILIAELFGKVSGNDISFTKTYSNSPMGKDKVLYSGTVSEDGNTITGQWKIFSFWNGTFRMTKAIEQKPSPKAVVAKKTEDA